MPGDDPPGRGGSRLLSLTPDQERIVRESIAAGATWAEAAVAAGVPYRRLQSRKEDQLRDLRTGQGKRGGRGKAVRDPTPAEIALSCAALRRRWSLDRWGFHEPDGPMDTGRHGREVRIR